MPNCGFFAHLGLFVVRDFLDTESCAKLRSEVGTSLQTHVTVVDASTSLEKVKENVRRTKQAEVSTITTTDMKRRLLTYRTRLENHFNVQLTDCEKPQFLVYHEGDFFHAHLDGDDHPDKPDFIKKRLLSVVIFLNDQTEAPAPDSFCGGSLVFYGLINTPQWGKYGFPLMGEAGLMIAFRSDIRHEVTPVLHGARNSIVSWFF